MRVIQELTEDWLFCLTEFNTEVMPELTDGCWKTVTVPHDWAINTDFSPENDPQPMETSILDYKENLVQIGRTGGLRVFGTGWYYKKIHIPNYYEHYFLEFDGIMSRGEVYVNGEKLAYRPYGYSSFCVDISDHVKRDAENELVVRVNVPVQSSRWYPGAGIYRPVRLVMKEEGYIPYQGVWVMPQYHASDQSARLVIQCTITGSGTVIHSIISPDGCVLGTCEGEKCEFDIDNAKNWDTENPQLYLLMSEVYRENRVTDRVCTKFGVRSIEFDCNQGFILNGKPQKIKGVCLHHDAGMIGAAYNRDAAKRQLRHLKEMGCNAIRTTHNPPQPDTLDLCDEMGFLVMDEAFDEWHITKAGNGYATLFEEWAKADLTDMIHRDRNHPSVILYSIGNEVPDQVLPEGRDTCHMLTEICHHEDPSRPVTCGFNKPKAAIENGLTEEVDVVGLNYSNSDYERYHREHPNWKIIASETCSCVSTRGEYFLPARMEMPVEKHGNYQVNSFDLSAPPFCCVPDIEFAAQKRYPYIAGEFVWSGFDYIGEPTPYRNEWPSRSSYFGIFDLAGLPKDRYWAYASQWGNKDILHLFPHWNWERGQEIDIHCYTNMPIVHLYLNGKEISESSRYDHRIVFGPVIFEPGTVRAVGCRMIDGKEQEICEDIIKTAKAPYKIQLHVDKNGIYVRRGEFFYVEADVVDEEGTICPDADNILTFSVEGGDYIASDNGDATSLRPFSEPCCNAFHGKLAAAVQAGKMKGYMVISVSSEGLKEAKAVIEIL